MSMDDTIDFEELSRRLAAEGPRGPVSRIEPQEAEPESEALEDIETLADAEDTAADTDTAEAADGSEASDNPVMSA